MHVFAFLLFLEHAQSLLRRVRASAAQEVGRGGVGKLESRRGSASRKHQFNATVTSTLHDRSTSILKIVFFGYLAAENFSTILAEKSTKFSPEVGQK